MPTELMCQHISQHTIRFGSFEAKKEDRQFEEKNES